MRDCGFPGRRAACLVTGVLVAVGLGVGMRPVPAAGARVAMTEEDFELPGTQHGALAGSTLKSAQRCAGCHASSPEGTDPYSNWAGSLMAQGARDPLLLAQMATANQDVEGVGYFCIRCHAPTAFARGHAAPVDGSAFDALDREGVSCHFCHSMVDPIYKPGVSPVEDEAILQALEARPTHYANSMFVLDPSGRRRGPRSDAVPPHELIQSKFHESSSLCGTCHEVGNLAVTKQADGTYRYNEIGQPSPTLDPRRQFPLERTYTEWKLSAFNKDGVDMGGRFNGPRGGVVRSCQNCHMPEQPGRAAADVAKRPAVHLHSFAGAAAQVLDLIVEQGRNDPEVDIDAIARAREAAVDMLQRAVTLEVRQRNDVLYARVINETGHKLPTGHIEGRRVWVNVRFFDRRGTIVAEHGGYDSATAELDERSTTVYQMLVGLSPDAASAVGLQAGPTGHMSLANTIEFDNRIPPRGFENAPYEAAGAPVVGWAYADGQHWDEPRFPIPAAATRATVTVYYQNTPRHYIEELRNNNFTTNDGEQLYRLWQQTGRGEPIAMASAAVNLDRSIGTRPDVGRPPGQPRQPQLSNRPKPPTGPVHRPPPGGVATPRTPNAPQPPRIPVRPPRP